MNDKYGSIKRMQEAFNQPKQRKDSIESLMLEAKQVSIDEINKSADELADKITLKIAIDRIIRELQKPEFFSKYTHKIAEIFYDEYVLHYGVGNIQIDEREHVYKISIKAAKVILEELCNQKPIRPQP